MPTYEYQCQKCGHRFSEFQRITDPPIRKCPSCHRRESVEQIISGGSGLIFRGSGFYITDYRKSKSGADSTGSSDKSSKDKSAGPQTDK